MIPPSSKQLRYLFEVASGATPDSGNPEFWNGDILWATPEDVSSLKSYRLFDTRRKLTPEGYQSCGATVAPPGTILLTKRAPIGQLAVLAQPACTNQGCVLLIPRNAGDSRYYYYWLAAHSTMLQILGRGSTFMELSTDDLKSLVIPEPACTYQVSIADYLDRETTRIDRLVAAKERMLKLLAEKRRALVTRAVTRGLDPSARLRDSGVPWLGEIPGHWNVVALRFLVDVFSGSTPDKSNPEYWDGIIPWVSPKDMKRPEISDSEDHVSITAISDTGLHLIPAEVVLIVVRGMILAHSFPTATTVRAVTINQDMKAFRCQAMLDPRFLRTFLSGIETFIVSQVDTAAHGTCKLETDVLGRLPVCVPPMDEQVEIAAYIGAKTSSIDRIANATKRTIRILKERRSALIGAAVTGQIDIGAAA